MQKITRRQFAALSLASGVSLSIPGCPLSFGAETAEPGEYAKRINPLIGASTSAKLGEGKTFPGATTPFGLVQLSPDTITGGDNAPGYSYEHTTIEGFSFLHLSGVGWYGDFGNLQVMPTTGAMRFARGRIGHPGEGWRSQFRHDTERAEANYYAVTLDDYGIRAEATAAPHAGMLRFTYPASSVSRIQIDLARRIAGTSSRQSVKTVGTHSIAGWMQCDPRGGGWGNGDGHVSYTLYFFIEFSKPLVDFGVWSIDVPAGGFPAAGKLVSGQFESDAYYAAVDAAKVISGCGEMEGEHLGFYTNFPTRTGESVLVKAGVSFVSIDGARRNLEHDIEGWEFDATRASGIRLWDKVVRKIEVEGGSRDERTIFATALYHASIDPRVVSDTDGKFCAADGKIKVSQSYRRRTTFSGWDAFRAEFPLLTIIDPDVVSDQINSLVDLAGESGKGYLERFELMNAYSGCMDGDPAISVILDAYRKGIRTFAVERAYAACVQTASGTDGRTNRRNNGFYLDHGYVPHSLTWTLEDAYFDWCVGMFARTLGKTGDAEIYLRRAANYKHCYDPSVKNMRARDEDGNWIPWRGKAAFGQGCTESNPGQQTWFVPHDVQGLIDLMGKNEFVGALEDMFEKTPPSFEWNAYYNHANEPVHHIAYLFVYAGKPWLTQKWVRRILKNAYHNDVNGICGNDDVGQMSAWYVLSALGFYPVCPGDNTYILGSPVFCKATIRLDPKWHRGKTFTILAYNNSEENVYVQSVSLNGRPLDRAWIRHEEIVAGGILEFKMGPEPNTKWGTSPEQKPPSMSMT